MNTVKKIIGEAQEDNTVTPLGQGANVYLIELTTGGGSRLDGNRLVRGDSEDAAIANLCVELGVPQFTDQDYEEHGLELVARRVVL